MRTVRLEELGILRFVHVSAGLTAEIYNAEAVEERPRETGFAGPKEYEKKSLREEVASITLREDEAELEIVRVRDEREGFGDILVGIRSGGAELTFKPPALLMIRGRAMVVTRERLKTFRTRVREWTKNVALQGINARLNACFIAACALPSATPF